jgi:hypothetical protein
MRFDRTISKETYPGKALQASKKCKVSLNLEDILGSAPAVSRFLYERVPVSQDVLGR